MSGTLRHHRFEFTFPAKVAPSWAPLVERWYQLDAFAFGLPDAVNHWSISSRPELIILASPEGSNRTDFDFAQSFLKTGVGSPSKFVHTLPNSRSAALLQVMKWGGPLLCVQNDPATFLTGLENAMLLSPARGRTWVLGVTRVEQTLYRCDLFEIASGDGPIAKDEFRWQPVRFEGNSKLVNTDADLLQWLGQPRSRIGILDRFEISREG